MEPKCGNRGGPVPSWPEPGPKGMRASDTLGFANCLVSFELEVSGFLSLAWQRVSAFKLPEIDTTERVPLMRRAE